MCETSHENQPALAPSYYYTIGFTILFYGWMKLREQYMYYINMSYRCQQNKKDERLVFTKSLSNYIIWSNFLKALEHLEIWNIHIMEEKDWIKGDM